MTRLRFFQGGTCWWWSLSARGMHTDKQTHTETHADTHTFQEEEEEEEEVMQNEEEEF